MSAELRFDDQVVLITGAAGALGSGYCRLLAQRGATLLLNDACTTVAGEPTSESQLTALAEALQARGTRVTVSQDSVEQGQAIVDLALSTYGRLDAVIHSAGILRDSPMRQLSQADWDAVYRVHLLGAYRLLHAAWAPMRKAGSGRIVLSISPSALYGNPCQANYAAAKGGLLGLTRSLAQEGGAQIRVNALSPLASSRMTDGLFEPALAQQLSPARVAPLCAYLAHPSCRYNGEVFEAGGGFFAQLRWQRARGFSDGNATIESVANSRALSDFSGADHPHDAQSALRPLIGSAPRSTAAAEDGPSIDPDAALGYSYPTQTLSYDERDLSLYALGVGAAEDPLDDSDLRLVYERHPDGFLPLCTWAVRPGIDAFLSAMEQRAPGMNFGLEHVLHGEHSMEFYAPLPSHGTLTTQLRIENIYDKKRYALVVLRAESSDADGTKLFANQLSIVVRGAGGFGGERGISPRSADPDRSPDQLIMQTVRANQALLYRLSGDWNPLHADPRAAREAGFPQPILHGSCSLGYCARHFLRAYAGNDPRRLRSLSLRFSDVVLPGEQLKTEIWQIDATQFRFRASVVERDKVVISGGSVEISTA
ncbi:MAG: SDR family NAD(P)-dependent oxidoreductase [Deltaproteobacteria bacterium]|nr:SDR family NAD(P)-dependent oxidoreductase [Deltaproteobacteria bacterium]